MITGPRHVVNLNEPQTSLLRSLALFRNHGITTSRDRDALAVLEEHGFAENVGTNGTGLVVAVVTRRGVLKALAARLILKHPDHEVPAVELLDTMRKEAR